MAAPNYLGLHFNNLCVFIFQTANSFNKKKINKYRLHKCPKLADKTTILFDGNKLVAAELEALVSQNKLFTPTKKSKVQKLAKNVFIFTNNLKKLSTARIGNLHQNFSQL